MNDVPVQFYQSVIAIELAVTGALLFQIRFFAPRDGTDSGTHLPDARIRLAMAVVLGATVFGSLYAIKHPGGATDEAVMVGLAVSVVPILLRVLPPLGRNPQTQRRDPQYTTTIVGLIIYCALTAATVLLLNR
jgi:hypothetical protein